MATTNRTKDLLNFIIMQRLDLDQYLGLVKPIKLAYIVKRVGGHECPDELIKTIIDWENGNKNASLETTLNEKYVIWLRETPNTTREQAFINYLMLYSHVEGTIYTFGELKNIYLALYRLNEPWIYSPIHDVEHQFNHITEIFSQIHHCCVCSTDIETSKDKEKMKNIIFEGLIYCR